VWLLANNRNSRQASGGAATLDQFPASFLTQFQEWRRVALGKEMALQNPAQERVASRDVWTKLKVLLGACREDFVVTCRRQD